MAFLALITGGGTGIGRAQAIALSKVEDGAVVIITGRRLEPLVATQKKIGPDRCHVLVDCDVGSIASWERIVGKVEELGGKLHFLGNTAGSTGEMLVPYESMDPDALIAYNTSYITGLQLSYHYMAPFLARGADDRGQASVVIDMSSMAAIANRGMASICPLYVPCKVAVNAITRTAYGLYKDRKIVAYGINPCAYLTDGVKEAAKCLGMTIEQHAQAFNPFLEHGDPGDFGVLSVALACQEMVGFESGVSYCMFPIPTKYRDPDDVSSSGSVLYSATTHSSEIDSLDIDAMRVGMTKIASASYCNGKKVPAETLRKIVMGMEEARQSLSQQAPSP